MTKDTTSSAPQITEESTIKPAVEDLAYHVNFIDFIFDGNETKRPPFQFNCGCCWDKIDSNRSFLVFFFHYFIIGAIVFISIALLAFAENSSLQTGIIAILSTCIGYLVSKEKQRTSAFQPTAVLHFYCGTVQERQNATIIDYVEKSKQNFPPMF